MLIKNQIWYCLAKLCFEWINKLWKNAFLSLNIWQQYSVFRMGSKILLILQLWVDLSTQQTDLYYHVSNVLIEEQCPQVFRLIYTNSVCLSCAFSNCYFSFTKSENTDTLSRRFKWNLSLIWDKIFLKYVHCSVN